MLLFLVLWVGYTLALGYIAADLWGGRTVLKHLGWLVLLTLALAIASICMPYSG